MDPDAPGRFCNTASGSYLPLHRGTLLQDPIRSKVPPPTKGDRDQTLGAVASAPNGEGVQLRSVQSCGIPVYWNFEVLPAARLRLHTISNTRFCCNIPANP